MKKLLTMALAVATATVMQAQDYKVETFKTKSGKDVNITLIKHATLAIDFQGYEIHVDAVPNYGTDYSKFPKGDLILVTHEHGDHFNPETIELISKPNNLLFMNQRCFDRMNKGMVLRNGDTRNITKDISLKVVPAYNTTPDHLQFHPKGVGNGYVLNIDGLKIYFNGTTTAVAYVVADDNYDFSNWEGSDHFAAWFKFYAGQGVSRRQKSQQFGAGSTTMGTAYTIDQSGAKNNLEITDMTVSLGDVFKVTVDASAAATIKIEKL